MCYLLLLKAPLPSSLAALRDLSKSHILPRVLLAPGRNSLYLSCQRLDKQTKIQICYELLFSYTKNAFSLTTTCFAQHWYCGSSSPKDLRMGLLELNLKGFS